MLPFLQNHQEFGLKEAFTYQSDHIPVYYYLLLPIAHTCSSLHTCTHAMLKLFHGARTHTHTHTRTHTHTHTHTHPTAGNAKNRRKCIKEERRSRREGRKGRAQMRVSLWRRWHCVQGARGWRFTLTGTATLSFGAKVDQCHLRERGQRGREGVGEGRKRKREGKDGIQRGKRGRGRDGW